MSDAKAMKMDEADRETLFATLFRDSYRRIFAYVHVLVGNYADAEDVVQQTSIILWRKFSEFEAGTNFAVWACNVARFEALNYLKRRRRYNARFSEAFQLKLAETMADVAGVEVNRRVAALEDCVKELPDGQRDLLRRCFGGVESVADVARQLGRSTHSVYSSLRNIRHKLFECVDRTTAEHEK